ncbi:hypothetical protein CYMTET_50702 [Cymbomonas tetramitiformis]|uniref:Uncharacterized protein n=1 Tax=Cymbomonas tetramitiformis TaxID=36881 RepID=A0AAE0BP89_9CHLO|nr:hypothetical protein CYMTET_50702 [Cymbomonas tetramitiformis]
MMNSSFNNAGGGISACHQCGDLAKSPDLVGDFVNTLNAKEKARTDNKKDKRQFNAECFKVKGGVQKGRTKKTAYFDPLLAEHAERYNFKAGCQLHICCATYDHPSQTIGWILDAVG